MKSALITIFICIVVYEIIEHLILPLFWMIRHRKRKSSVGPSSMIGRKCLVKKWDGNRGKVQVGSELWNATAESQLNPGEEAVIQDIQGLTLTISASGRLLDPCEKNKSKKNEHGSK